MRRGYADGPFGQLHFQDAGAGRPLILLHQAIMSSGQFDNVFAPLIDRGLRPIALDMPGFGMSDPPDFPPMIADYAQAVMPVLDWLGIGNAAVVGHHTGALVATELTLAHPDRIGAVILAGPMIIDEDERQAGVEQLVDREKAFVARPHGAHFGEIAVIREMLAAGTISDERISDYVVQAMQAYGHGAYWYGHNAAFTYRHDDPLRCLVQPTLLLTNDGDMTHASALAAKAMRPDFEWFEIKGGGIDICDQAPCEWASAIADFLDRHP
jgi:pimeloyl-ACP methyl ester carboxylesterase